MPAPPRVTAPRPAAKAARGSATPEVSRRQCPPSVASARCAAQGLRQRHGRPGYSKGGSSLCGAKTVISILAIVDAARPWAPESVSPLSAAIALARCPTVSALLPGANPSLCLAQILRPVLSLRVSVEFQLPADVGFQSPRPLIPPLDEAATVPVKAVARLIT